jgi:type IV secretion system protein VirB6
MGVFQSLEQSFDSALTIYVTSTSQAMSAYAVAIAVTGNSLYFLWMANAIARGDVNEPMSKLLKDIVLMVFVSAVAFSAGNYQYFVIDGMRALTTDLISVVNANASGAHSIGEILDDLFTGCISPPNEPGASCVSFVSVLWKKALEGSNFYGIPDLTYLSGALLVYLSQLVMVVLSFIPWIMSKTALAGFLAIGPFFILGLMWPLTKKYFENWLSATLGNVLTLVLVASICSIVPTIFRKYVQDAFNGVLSSEVDVIGRMWMLFAISLVLAVAALHTSQKAAHLAGGGVAMDGRGVGGMVAQAMMNKLFMGKVNPDDKGKDDQKNQDKPNSVSKPSMVQKASAATSQFAGKQVRNVLDALNKKR